MENASYFYHRIALHIEADESRERGYSLSVGSRKFEDDFLDAQIRQALGGTLRIEVIARDYPLPACRQDW
jgi:hypothetical protein